MFYFKDIYTAKCISYSHSWYILHIVRNVTFTWIPHYTHDYTYTQTCTHIQTDTHTRPFPAGPCRCSRNSRVGLSGKQTVRGCWESSLGLQIIVCLTKVSGPAPLLLHTYCAYTPTTNAYAHISSWPVYIKGKHICNQVVMGPCLCCSWAKSKAFIDIRETKRQAGP